MSAEALREGDLLRRFARPALFARAGYCVGLRATAWLRFAGLALTVIVLAALLAPWISPDMIPTLPT